MSSGNEGSAPAVNAGSLENKGFEMEIGWNDQIRDFAYSASLNISHIKIKYLIWDTDKQSTIRLLPKP